MVYGWAARKALLRLATHLAIFGSLCSVATANDKVSLALEWRVNGAHGAYFLAKERGFFKEQGIDIDIMPGSGSAKNVALVAGGSATFALIDGTNLVNGVAKDIPIKFVAANNNLSPYAVCVRKDRGVSDVKELEGKTIVSTAGTSLTNLFPAVLKANKLDPSKVKMVYQDGATALASVAEGRVDGLLSGVDDQPLVLQDRGIPMTCWKFSDIGVPAIGKGIVASDSTIKSNPDLVRRFLAAVKKGYEAAMADPDAGASAARNAQDAVARDDLASVKRHETINFTLMTPGVPGGSFLAIDKGMLAKQVDIMKEYQGLKTEKTTDDFYTSEFLSPTDQ